MPHDIRALCREWFQKVWNDHDDAAIDRLAWPDVICHGLDETGHPIAGLELFRVFYRAFLSAFPDLYVIVKDIMVEGDQTAVRLSFNGTHRGNGLGLRPTGRSFSATAIAWVRWKDGKIIEAWNEFDAAAMMRQLQANEVKMRA